MNNIAHQFQSAGLSPRQNSPGFYSSTYEKELSFRSQESTNTDLVIQTKDGDHITLNSNSFTQMDAYMYDSKGVVQTESGTALFSQNYREITLASGQSFSFSVAGDLSEEELEDIEAILQGLDEVMAEMQQGDMFGAMDNALEIGAFDSISSYTADLNYQHSYEMSSTVAATTTHSLPDHHDQPVHPAEQIPANHGHHGEKDNSRIDFDTFFDKLMKQIEAQEQKQLDYAKKAIDKLFKHHLGGIEKDNAESESIYTTLKTAMKNIDSLIEEMQEKVVENQPATTEEE